VGGGNTGRREGKAGESLSPDGNHPVDMHHTFVTPAAVVRVAITVEWGVFAHCEHEDVSFVEARRVHARTRRPLQVGDAPRPTRCACTLQSSKGKSAAAALESGLELVEGWTGSGDGRWHGRRVHRVIEHTFAKLLEGNR
jgi:hypothetical protein